MEEINIREALTDEGKIIHDLANVFISKNNEIKRLNNIINELESYLKYNIETENPFYIKDTFKIVLNRLQELKGDSSNEYKKES